jgi:hypothetical protein
VLALVPRTAPLKATCDVVLALVPRTAPLKATCDVVLALVSRKREVPHSNSGPEIGDPDSDLSWYFSNSHGKCWNGTL